MGSNIVAGTLSALLLVSFPAQQSNTPQPVHEVKSRVHVVQRGETLGSIAKAVYGSESYWLTLWNDNAWIENPSLIMADWQLSLRDASASATLTIDQVTILTDKLKPTIVPPPPTASPQSTPQPSLEPTASPTITPLATPLPTERLSTDQPMYIALYKKAGNQYGVPWQILYGLHITETGGRDGLILNHSGSGATGPMQFMPGTWRAYGVDCNGDGSVDIANVEDAVCGAANYLQKHGSLMNGLRSYGGNTKAVLRIASENGLDTTSI